MRAQRWLQLLLERLARFVRLAALAVCVLGITALALEFQAIASPAFGAALVRVSFWGALTLAATVMLLWVVAWRAPDVRASLNRTMMIVAAYLLVSSTAYGLLLYYASRP